MSRRKCLAIALSVAVLVTWTAAYCRGFIGEPELQAEIRKLKSADVAADVDAALAAGDTRFAVIGGQPLRFPGTNGMAARVFGWRCVAATTDIIMFDPQNDRLVRVGTDYAYEYNDKLLPRLLVLEQWYLDELETILADDPSGARDFEKDWERATRYLSAVYGKIDEVSLRYGGPWKRCERLCWELFLVRYRCWALEAELGMSVRHHARFRPDLELSTRSQILDDLAELIDAPTRRGYYDGWSLPRI